jgi:predicted metalloenzyme YecM
MKSAPIERTEVHEGMPLIKWKEIRERVPAFLDNAFALAKELGLDVHDLDIDHIGLRIKDPYDVHRIRGQLEAVSVGNEPISESIIHGRTITIYRLQEVLLGMHNGRILQIPCVEVPDPKTPHDYPYDGIEHVEFVLPCGARTVNQMITACKKRFGPIKDFVADLPTKNRRQLPNPTVSFKGKNEMCAIKFHPYPIEEIVKGKTLTKTQKKV